MKARAQKQTSGLVENLTLNFSKALGSGIRGLWFRLDCIPEAFSQRRVVVENVALVVTPRVVVPVVHQAPPDQRRTIRRRQGKQLLHPDTKKQEGCPNPHSKHAGKLGSSPPKGPETHSSWKTQRGRVSGIGFRAQGSSGCPISACCMSSPPLREGDFAIPLRRRSRGRALGMNFLSPQGQVGC